VTFLRFNLRLTVGVILSALLLTYVTPPPLKANGQMDIAYSCTTGPKADAARAKDACDEFLKLLQQHYPTLRFDAPKPDVDAPSLQLEVVAAGRAGWSVRSIWTGQDVTPVASEILAVSAMDRGMSPSLLSNLLRRLLLANPLPF